MSPSLTLAEVDLQPMHTFHLPARAGRICTIHSSDDLHAYADHVRRGQPMVLLGEGSNTVFLSDLTDHTVWRMGMVGRTYLGVQDGCHRLRVMAGENWHSLVEWSVAMGWPGLENLALIPGSVGAGPVQNIGAYGLELKDRISGVEVFDVQSGTQFFMSTAECQFAYRDSVFKSRGPDQLIITAVHFALPVDWTPVMSYGDLASRIQAGGSVTPFNVMQSVVGIRTQKLPDPVVLGNSGSFFKNPIVDAGFAAQFQCDHPDAPVYPVVEGGVKLAAGWLIDQCGLKGIQKGGVSVYKQQALILINEGEGEGKDLQQLIRTVQQAVFQRFGVQLEPEPNLLGFTVPD